ncbi:histone H1-binding protein [Cordyceps fumosorosea ARSEF 2679]|uniref:Histone H1-binding protein n=1 Tax=Cordyceps fumosorosea (strain ARSEF 2679) TaxID=1081104 RepID=A0A167LEY7_CORFA|nr:histone H1-binding protein [Cordyceps fumosorosea ARSEF 2679]OAA53007.1 histone H1-binding protein [Cordyceps fumosorosea ARSEF 2679]
MADTVEQTQPIEEPTAPLDGVVAPEAAALEAVVATEESAADVPSTEQGETVEEDEKSKKVTLADLSAKGSALYAHKNYEAAAEVFSRASNLQAELNGELAPENAEILFHYGRSLFRVGQSKSDVLGGQAAGEAKKTKANGSSAAQASSSKLPTLDENVKEASAQASEKKEGDAKKALFQFTGDENFVDSDDSDEEGDAEPEEEEDDLATAFEILDLARVCYMKQLAQLEQATDSEKGKETVSELSPAERHVKERLADTHDTLAEISLESERYPNAIEDGRVSLNYKLELYPVESEVIAEAHYKLSLALEFSSITSSGDDGANTKREEIDQDLRDEAVKEMDLAIKSFRLKLQGKEVEMATSASPTDNDLIRKDITEMKELIADMEQRLVDLRKNPIDPQELLGATEANVLGGLFGAVLGETPEETQARVAEATKGAVDLTSMVRKKAKPEAAAAAPPTESSTNGKRKAEDEPIETGAESPKKARVEEAA